MSIPLYQVDAFTSKAFRGNPAAVCLLRGPADAGWMQSVASEMNLSETAFLYKEEDGFRLRWFTPAAEVELCGHATLASAHILWETGILAHGKQARFHTLSGLLTAEQRDELIELNFPATPPVETDPPAGLAEALGVQPLYVGRSKFDYLVRIGSQADLRAMQPDMRQLKALPVRGVMVTAAGQPGKYDFVSRFFAPAVGVNEDPVTGSAHCCLAPYWMGLTGKSEMQAYQDSNRGGEVRVRVEGDRVALGGQAVTVLRGELVDN